MRRGGDSNPRSSFPDTAFPVLHNRPLCHLSDFAGAPADVLIESALAHAGSRAALLSQRHSLRIHPPRGRAGRSSAKTDEVISENYVVRRAKVLSLVKLGIIDPSLDRLSNSQYESGLRRPANLVTQSC